MKGLFFAYLEDPTLENFLDLRSDCLAHDGFNPYSDELDELDPYLESGDFAAVVETISKHIFPNYFLSPGTHLQLAFAYHKIGNEERASAEYAMGSILLDGIELTGDGSREKPFLVTRTSDEYDILFRKGLEFRSQALQELGGRSYDVLTVENGPDIWFDVTEILGIMKRRFESLASE